MNLNAEFPSKEIFITGIRKHSITLKEFPSKEIFIAGIRKHSITLKEIPILNQKKKRNIYLYQTK